MTAPTTATAPRPATTTAGRPAIKREPAIPGQRTDSDPVETTFDGT